MKIQRKSWDCGIVCTINALKAIGLKYTYKQIAAFTGSTRALGTNQYGLLSAFSGLGIPATEYKVEDQEEAFDLIKTYLELGHSVIIDIYSGGHWVTLVGLLGDRVLVWDSDFGVKNKRENGSYTLSKEQLFKKWTYTEEDGYYLIVVNYDNKV